MDLICLLAHPLKYIFKYMALVFHGELRHNQGNVNVNLEVLLFKEEDVYIAYSPALDISAFGATEQEAKEEFGNHMRSYITYCMNKKTLFRDLKAHGWEVKSKKRIKAPTEEQLIKMNDTYNDIRNNKNYKTIREDIAIPAV